MHTSEPRLFVLCQRPGLIRGGVSNPGTKGYDPNFFTAEQLAELLREPAITLVYGRQLQSDNIADYLGAFETDSRTRFRGSSIDTDAGANAATGVIAQEKGLREEVARVEHAAREGGADGVTAVKAAAAPSTDAATIDAAADLVAGKGRSRAR